MKPGQFVQIGEDKKEIGMLVTSPKKDYKYVSGEKMVWVATIGDTAGIIHEPFLWIDVELLVLLTPQRALKRLRKKFSQWGE